MSLTVAWLATVTVSLFNPTFAQLDVFHGENNYSTYYVGNFPIILLSQHGGYIEPSNDTIPDRHAGCWNGTGCIWIHDCASIGLSQNNTECEVTTPKDSYSKELAMCLREQMSTNVTKYDGNGNSYTEVLYPHLVINELHRIKLDSNRDYGEATLNNEIAGQTYNEIHYKWMKIAKNNVTQQCNWGLTLDIHGHKRNSFVHLGYRVSQSQLLESNNQINDEIDSTSMRHLAEYSLNNFNTNLSSIIRGNNSLGTYLNESGYLVVPSLLQPSLNEDLYYFQGGFATELHGSEDGGVIDAIQVEINRDIRFNETKRSQFCQEFSQSVIKFIKHWYNISNCGFEMTVAQTNEEDIVDAYNETGNGSNDDTDGALPIGKNVRVFVLIIMLVVYFCS